MPKHPETSKKQPVFITEDNSVVSLKAPDQPLRAEEKVVLNNIYNESILRLKRTVRLLNELESFLAAQPQDIKRQAGNIKQYLIDQNADPDVLHALKMLKRHFYVNISNNSINNILVRLQPVRNNTLKVYKGLQGQLDISIEAFQNDPSPIEIKNLKPKAYVLVLKQGQWELSYYENGVQKRQINVDEVNPNISQITTVNQFKTNSNILMRSFMLYHANQGKALGNKVYISHISKRKQNDPQNREIGYVWSQQSMASEYFGAIHIDYRLLAADPFKAMGTLIHEASHRYAWVNDRGYYHQTKNVKGGGTRPYPNEVNAETLRATNNADSYSYFVLDMTGAEGFVLDNDNVPDWFHTEKFKPLPQESSNSGFAKYALFGASIAALTVAGAAGYYYLRKIA